MKIRITNPHGGKCPKCSKPVLAIRNYTMGESLYVHANYEKDGMPHIDGCFVKKPNPHGGSRKGAGRPKGTTNQVKVPHRVITKSVSMTSPDWDRFDAQKGSLSRGAYIVSILPQSH